MTSSARTKFAWKRFNGYAEFFVLYPLLVIAIFLLCWPFYRAHQAARHQVFVEREQSFLMIAEHIFIKEFQERVGDLRVLVHSELLQGVVNRGTPGDIQRFESYLASVANAYQAYDQIRLINAAGQEVVRVNLVDGEAQVVSESALQDKSQRDYFKNTINLNAGQVAVSPMDLNVENGRVEQPYKPMIRFSTPVFNDEGQRAGIVVLNYLAGDMLAVFRRLMNEDEFHQGMLVDERGFWLSNHDRSNEWGFVLGREDLVFQSLYPEAWRAISSSDQGQIETSDGLFLFQTVKPLSWDGRLLPHAVNADVLGVNPKLVQEYQWKVIAFVPRRVIDDATLLHSVFMKALVFGFLAMLAIIMWIYVGHRQRLSHQLQTITRRHDDLHERYENSPSGDLILDSHWRLIEINQTALSWLGYRKKEIIHRSVSELLTGPSNLRFAAAVSEFEHAEGFNDKQFNFKSVKGVVVPLSMSARLTRDKVSGEPQWHCTLFDIVERLALERELETQAHFDSLTNVPNRRWFLDLANRELSRATRQKTTFCILMIDIDHFKNVNDTFGHDTGDQVLKSLADRAASILRREDLFARYGGEEFIALLPESDLEKAVDVAERIREYISSTSVRLKNGKELSITVSIGVAAFASADSLEEIIKRADTALYEAKERGRNLVCSEDFGMSLPEESPELI